MPLRAFAPLALLGAPAEPLRFALLAALTLAASPLAFLAALLAAGFGIARWDERRALLVPALTIAGFGAIEVLISRSFPDPGRYPFSWQELAAALIFCVLGAALTWRVERAKGMRWIFVVYLVACVACYLIPSAIGENVARLRYAAVPMAVLMLSLRRWRPLPVCLAALGLAISWNLSPIASNVLKGRDLAANPAYASAIAFLRTHSNPRTASRPWTLQATGLPSTSPRQIRCARRLPPERLPAERGAVRQLAPVGISRGCGAGVRVAHEARRYSARRAPLCYAAAARPALLRTANLTVLEAAATADPDRARSRRVLRPTGTRILVELPAAPTGWSATRRTGTPAAPVDPPRGRHHDRVSAAGTAEPRLPVHPARELPASAVALPLARP